MKTTELQKASNKLLLAVKNLERAETALPDDCAQQLPRALVCLADFILDAEKERSRHEAATSRQLRELSKSISGLVVARCKNYFEEYVPVCDQE